MPPLQNYGISDLEFQPRDEESYQQYVWSLHSSSIAPALSLPAAPDVYNSSQAFWPVSTMPQFSAPAQVYPVVPSLPMGASQAFAALTPHGQQWNAPVSPASYSPQAQKADWAHRPSSPNLTSGALHSQPLSTPGQNEAYASWIACKWPSCTGGFYLDERSLEQHLRTHPQPVGGGSARCEWIDCASMSELRNLKQHVWDSHLGLRWVCDQCCRADFQSKRSRMRHKQACQGANAPPGPVVRCAHCKKACGSQAEMNQHAPACAFLRSPKL